MRPQRHTALDRTMSNTQTATAAAAHLRAAFTSAPHGIAFLDAQGRITLANDALGKILSAPADALIGQTWREVSHEADEEAIDAALVGVLGRAGAAADVAGRHVTADARPRQLRLRLVGLDGGDGDAHAVVHAIDETEAHGLRVITEGRTQVIEAIMAGVTLPDVLRISCRAFAEAALGELELVYVVEASDDEAAPLRVGSAPGAEGLSHTLVGAVTAALEGAPGGAHVVGDVRAEGAPSWASAVAEAGFLGVRIEADPGRADTPSARLVLLTRHATAADAELAALGERAWEGLRAVHSWVAAREANATHRHRLEMMLQNFPGLAYRCRNDRRWTMYWISAGAMDLTGYAPEELTGEDAVSFAELQDVRDRDAIWEQVQQAIVKRERFQMAYRMHTRKGQQRWVWEQGEALYDERGEVAALEGYIIDITDERRARGALHASRERLKTILESVGEALVAADAEGHVTHFNLVAERLTGWRADDARGRRLSTILKVTDGAGRNPFDHTIAEMRSPQQPEALTLVDRAGVRRLVDVTIAPLDGDASAPSGVVAVIRDVTDKIATEEQLRHAHKMKAVGQLAGGVAHDFNNLLTGILGYADLLESSVGDEELRGFARTIADTSRRAAALTRQLLTFSRRAELERVPIDLNAVVVDAAALLERTLGPRYTVEIDLDAGAPNVSGDRAMLQSALLNLGVNARDAMPRGGRVRFQTRRAALGHGDPRLGGELAPGDYVEVEVTDTGAGIAEDAIARLFEPFFTTKDPGKGTGLGLAAVYGAVRSHHGRITAANLSEGGASFVMLLPEAHGGDADDGELASTRPALVSGRGRVLLLEHDEVVRELLARMIAAAGYEVVSTDDGEGALERFRRERGGFDLVILDHVLPAARGGDVLARMAAIDPDLRALVTSGGAAASSHDAARPWVRGVLQKPFAAAELSRMIARARK